MSYEVEQISAILKEARKNKGLSQRDLSDRAGVPQSHISKIEGGGVNLTVSSLAAIANALDLEIALVPRKAAPAVQAIIRGLDDVPRASPDVRREFDRIARQLDDITGTDIDPSALETLRRRLREIRQFENLVGDTQALRGIRKALQGLETTGNTEALREAVARMTSLRNAVAHQGVSIDPPSLSRPAYRPDDDDD